MYKPLGISEIMFSHQKSIIKGFFFIWHIPRGSCFAKIRVSCQTFKMVIERCFYLIPHFDHLKTTGRVRNHGFSSEEYYKSFFFYLTYPQGVFFCQNKSQLSNLQNGHTGMFLFNSPFWPFKNHWTYQKSRFLIRRVLKKPFFYLTSTQGVLFYQNKSQLSNL